jgi:alcohol dehydrogenase
MAWGSNIAGIAITSARVGLAHAVAAGIGALTGLPHGICVGLALPDTVRLNLRSRTATRDELMFHLGVTAGNGENWEAAVRRKLAEVQASVDFPKTARDAGQPFDVDDDLIDKIVGSGRLDTNPVQLSRRTLRGVLTSISG